MYGACLQNKNLNAFILYVYRNTILKVAEMQSSENCNGSDRSIDVWNWCHLLVFSDGIVVHNPVDPTKNWAFVPYCTCVFYKTPLDTR